MNFTWLKGHGTENDFVLLPDPDGRVHGALDPQFVAALCDRHRGIGADGVIRVIRTTAIQPHDDGGAEWFMDYRNADGSESQMCGNGVRVLARHLVDSGLADEGGPVMIASRDGVKAVEVAGDQLRVDMGRFMVGGRSTVTVDHRAWSAAEIHTGNPHAVVHVDSLTDAGSLADEPGYDRSAYPAGVNIEFVESVGPGHIAVRVHERGSGETRSCGTGACAAALASALADGRSPETDLPVRYRVDVPGGTLHVDWTIDDRLYLEGPAVIVAEGSMRWYR